MLIIGALIQRAKAARRKAKSASYSGIDPWSQGVRRTFHEEASACDNVGKRLAETWEIEWGKGSR
jgi:hypothetical protein